jgi:hypothetical protein
VLWEIYTVHLLPPLDSTTTSRLHPYSGQPSLRLSVVVITFVLHWRDTWCLLKGNGLWKEKASRDKCKKDDAHFLSRIRKKSYKCECKKGDIIGEARVVSWFRFLGCKHGLVFCMLLYWVLGNVVIPVLGGCRGSKLGGLSVYICGLVALQFECSSLAWEYL